MDDVQRQEIVDPVHVIVISDEEVSEKEEQENDEETVTMDNTEVEPSRQNEARDGDVQTLVCKNELDIDETEMVSVI